MKLRQTFWALAIALMVCSASVQGQDQRQDAPTVNPSSPISPMDSDLGGGYAKSPAPAARGVSPDYDSQPYDPSQVIPDQNTLAGAQLLGVGSLQHARNVFDPAISISQLGQSISGTGGQQTLYSQSLAGGNLNFDRTWSLFHFTTLYAGGENFVEGQQTSYRTQFHDLSVTQQIDWARWHLLLRDDFVASPGAAFAGTGMGGPGLIAEFSSTLGASLTNIGQEFVPIDSIETGTAMRYRNAILGQTEYALSRRSTLTFAGSYGLLRFSGIGYVSSQMVDAQAGYDYSLDPFDSIAIIASYGKIDYTGTVNSTVDYVGALAYGRKITGRLAFQAAAGPERIVATNGTGNYQLWFQSVHSALTYDRRRSGISFMFARALNSGSGVFLGAESNMASSSARYQFTRFWMGTVTGGYAQNTSIAPVGVVTTTFDDWFVGANLGRRLGPHMQVNFNYGLQRQNSPTSCPVANCGASGFQQTFGMTVNWHLHPAG